MIDRSMGTDKTEAGIFDICKNIFTLTLSDCFSAMQDIQQVLYQRRRQEVQYMVTMKEMERSPNHVGESISRTSIIYTIHKADIYGIMKIRKLLFKESLWSPIERLNV